jgi:hypothetical protein
MAGPGEGIAVPRGRVGGCRSRIVDRRPGIGGPHRSRVAPHRGRQVAGPRGQWVVGRPGRWVAGPRGWWVAPPHGWWVAPRPGRWVAPRPGRWVGPRHGRRLGGPRSRLAGLRRCRVTPGPAGSGSRTHRPVGNGRAGYGRGRANPRKYGCRGLWPGGEGGGSAGAGCPPSGAWCRNRGWRARLGPETTKRRPLGRRFGKSLGGDLLSHLASQAVPSALEGLTSGFGMGPGVSPPLWPPKHSGASGYTGNLQNYTASACNRSWLPSPRPISTGQLHTLLCFHFRPINPVV